MPGDFLDTSALAKHYHSEVGSAVVDQLWLDVNRELFVSRLAAVEIVSAFAGKVRAAVISGADFDILRRRFAADLSKKKRPLAPACWRLIFWRPNACCAYTARCGDCELWMPCNWRSHLTC